MSVAAAREPADIAMDWLRDNYVEAIPGVEGADSDRLYAELVREFAVAGYQVVPKEVANAGRAWTEDKRVYALPWGQVPPWMEPVELELRTVCPTPFTRHTLYRLRPLTEPPQPLDETTSTTTTEGGGLGNE